MQELLNFTTGLSIVLLVMVLVSIRRAHIRVEYSVSWLGSALTLLVLSRSPGALGRLANLAGIRDAGEALLLFVGCLFLLVLFRFSVIISHLRDANIALAQRLAIVEYRLRSNEEKEAARN